MLVGFIFAGGRYRARRRRDAGRAGAGGGWDGRSRNFRDVSGDRKVRPSLGRTFCVVVAEWIPDLVVDYVRFNRFFISASSKSK